MRLGILSLDTSHLPGSIVLAEGREEELSLRSTRSLPGRDSTARAFAPCIREMLVEAALTPQGIGLVAVDIGPGSFTGLRIAVTFAKTFAYATGADILGISCMDILAQQAAEVLDDQQHNLWTLVDAHRGQVFAARYEIAGQASPQQIQPQQIQPQQTQPTAMLDLDRWCDRLEPGDRVTGPIIGRIANRLPSDVHGIAAEARMPSAATLARIAWQRWREGARDDLWRLAPDYVRKSAAEERLDTKRP